MKYAICLAVLLLGAQAIGVLGPAVKRAGPFLSSTTNSEQSQISFEAIKSLHAIDPKSTIIS
jgi:hypothetical protein